MREINYQELQQMQQKNPDLLLIDVRESFEHQMGNIGGVNIPTSSLATRVNEIPKEGEVVLYCRSDERSRMVIQSLEQAGWDNLINLKGGMIMAR